MISQLSRLKWYLHLMRTHDFSYNYSDDFHFWHCEQCKRLQILEHRKFLILTSRGRKFVTLAERRYGHV